MAARSRPSPELLAAQRATQARHHQEAAARPFDEKVRRVLELQKLLWPILRERRELRPWEKPWEIDG